MSLKTIIWAFEQKIRPSVTKFVLVALGDNANDETGIAYPSIAAICEKTSEDRKTVITALAKLEEKKLISDTGKRVGATKQIVVYRLDGYLRDNGTVPNAAPLPNSPVFPIEQSRFSLETVPYTGHGTATEPQGNHSTPKPPRGGLALAELRKLKQGKPTNPMAVRLGWCVGRQPSTEWNEAEVKLFKQVARRSAFDGELALVERFYQKNRKRDDVATRQSVETLLKFWTSEVDKSRAWCEKHPERKAPAAPKPMADTPPKDFLPAPDLDSQRSFAISYEARMGRLPAGWKRDEQGELEHVGLNGCQPLEKQ